MTNVILLAPLKSNGGITSWTKKFIKSFPNEEFNIIPISQVLTDKNGDSGFITRARKGLKEVRYILHEIKKVIKKHDIKILHTTTSGSLGTYRDYRVAKLCKKHGIKTIMHCRYGCIPQIIEAKDFYTKLLICTMKQYDQVWVLDKHSFEVLSNIPELTDKVHLTPNSIEVKSISEIPSKKYRNFAFIANVLPTKGIFELIEAFKNVNYDVTLHIVGPAHEDILNRLKEMIGDMWDCKIIYHGRLQNEDALLFLKGMDVLILPTYYKFEAFPISIIEAMSYGKFVISTPRAAIPDMLTALDGSNCGILVPEKSIKELTNAINWVCEHKDEADEICRKAFDKVYNSYRTEVVYNLYRANYRQLI